LKRYYESGLADLCNRYLGAIESGQETEKFIIESEYVKAVANEGKQQLLDYYESDLEEIAPILDKSCCGGNMLKMIDVFENYAQPVFSNSGYEIIPKRKWNDSNGFWSNFLSEWNNFNRTVLPRS
jgi:hypothetical protein